MGWGTLFVSHASGDTVRPLYVLDSIPLDITDNFGGDLKLSSFRLEGHLDIIQTGTGTSSITYGSLALRSWRCSLGSIRLALVSHPGPQAKRGRIVALRVGFEGLSLEEFETVFTGQISDVSFDGVGWAIDVNDIVGSLVNRMAGDVAESGIFTGQSATTATGLVVNLSSPIAVSSTAGFEREDGGDYLLKVGSDAAGWSLVRATGKTAGEFTGCTWGAFRVDDYGGGFYPFVLECMMVEGQPLAVAKAILTGTNTAGTIPATWSFGLSPAFVDVDDIDEFSARIPTGTDWRFHTDSEIPDALSELIAWLAPGGFFLCQRHGKITARAVLPILTHVTQSNRIEDDDVVSLTYSMFSADCPVEYGSVSIAIGGNIVEDEIRAAIEKTVGKALSMLIPRVRWNGSDYLTTAESIETVPAASVAKVSLPWVSASGSDWAEEVAERLKEYYTRIPERIEIVLAGFRHCELTIGDVVMLDFEKPIAIRGRRALVVGGGPDWFEGVTRLSLILSADTGFTISRE